VRSVGQDDRTVLHKARPPFGVVLQRGGPPAAASLREGSGRTGKGRESNQERPPSSSHPSLRAVQRERKRKVAPWGRCLRVSQPYIPARFGRCFRVCQFLQGRLRPVAGVGSPAARESPPFPRASAPGCLGRDGVPQPRPGPVYPGGESPRSTGPRLGRPPAVSRSSTRTRNRKRQSSAPRSSARKDRGERVRASKLTFGRVQGRSG
jgi:hypothetical protein